MDKNMFFDSLSDEELLNQIAQQKPMTPEELSLLSEKQNEMPLVGVPVEDIPEQAPVVAPATNRNINRTQENSNTQNIQSNITEDDTIPNPPTPPMSRQEALLEEYMKLSGKEGTEELKSARERDRMLKVGGALGDALATIINAEGQRRAMIPGVQVQQGAGLGEITKMFETAPEVASDLSARREALLKQYAELAREQREKLDRDLKERQVSAYVTQTKAQARKAMTDIGKKEGEEKLSVGEATQAREFAKTWNQWQSRGKSQFSENEKLFEDAINKLEKKEVTTGVIEGIKGRQEVFDTKAKALEREVRSAINGMLRETLGPQFTEKEGERIFEQSFSKIASPEDNIKSMKRELNKIKKTARSIEDQGRYFEQNKGTLVGYIAPKETEGGIAKKEGVFPKTVINKKTKETATVQNEQELKEALAEGFE